MIKTVWLNLFFLSFCNGIQMNIALQSILQPDILQQENFDIIYNKSDSFQIFMLNQKYIRGCLFRDIATQDTPMNSDQYLTPDKIDLGLCNVIFFENSYLNASYEFLPSTVAADLTSSLNISLIQELVNLKISSPWLKVMVSIGGPTITDYSLFSEMIQSNTNRQVFINSTIEYLRQNSVDGVDLNWASLSLTSEDMKNLDILVKEFREAIDQESASTDADRLWLSVSVLPSVLHKNSSYVTTSMCDIELGADFVTLQAFGAHKNANNAGHNAPWDATFNDTLIFGASEVYSVQTDLLDWIHRCVNKVVLGLPAFGIEHRLTQASSPNQCGTFLEPVDSAYSKVVPYRSLMQMQSETEIKHIPPEEPRYSSYACYSGYWTPFDDEAMIAMKTKLAQNFGAIGTSIFHLDQDFVNGKFPLLTSMNAALFSLTSDECKADHHSNIQIKPQFPPGIWDGQDCSLRTLLRLPSLCFNSLSASSSDGERLACLLITQPGTKGSIPFGMYPSNMGLDQELSEIESADLTPIFSDCALAQMIHDGCFGFRRNTWPGYSSAYAFATKEQYSQFVSSNYMAGGGLSAEGGSLKTILDVYYVSGGMNGNAHEYDLLGIRREWANEIGTLSNSCIKRDGILLKYLNSNYLDLWKNIQNIGSTEELLNNTNFIQLAEYGSYVPADFIYAVRYASDMHAYYNASQVNSTKTQGFGVSWDAILTAQHEDSPRRELKTSFRGNLAFRDTHGIIEAIANATVQSKFFRYGYCNWNAVQNSENWDMILEACAKNAADNLSGLGSAARVLKDGFVSIYSLVAAAGVRVNPIFQVAWNQYFSYCSCFPFVQQNASKYAYDCFAANGTWISRPTTSKHCKMASITWWQRDTHEVLNNPKYFDTL